MHITLICSVMNKTIAFVTKKKKIIYRLIFLFLLQQRHCRNITVQAGDDGTSSGNKGNNESQVLPRQVNVTH